VRSVTRSAIVRTNNFAFAKFAVRDEFGQVSHPIGVFLVIRGQTSMLGRSIVTTPLAADYCMADCAGTADTHSF
jgi:hypothetical protein